LNYFSVNPLKRASSTTSLSKKKHRKEGKKRGLKGGGKDGGRKRTRPISHVCGEKKTRLPTSCFEKKKLNPPDPARTNEKNAVEEREKKRTAGQSLGRGESGSFSTKKGKSCIHAG